MIDKNTTQMLNKQINMEFYSAYLYLEISNYYSDVGLDGFANWFYVQMQEEYDHGNLIRSYILNNSQKVVLDTIENPTTAFSTYLEPLVASLEHEQKVTKSINDIFGKAFELKEYRTVQFLDWFIKEQVEEEKSATDLITKYKLFASDAKALYMLDQELASRVYAPPSLVLD